MSIPKVRRLPVTRQDLQEIDLPIPPNLARYPYQHQFNAEEYRLLRLGLIEEEIAFVEDGWLYYFARHQPYKFHYKIRLVEHGEAVVITELWADPQLTPEFISEGTPEHELTNAIHDISKREYPATLNLYRRQPEAMNQSNTYPMDVELSKQDFWKVVWGFIPRSMDDHWRSWFDFEVQTFHIYWYWKPYHLYQIRFEDFNGGYRAVEVKIAKDMEGEHFNPTHAEGMMHTFIRWCHYRFEEV